MRVFLYNQQVTDTLTQSFIALAQRNGIPVVGVYETMPEPGYDYQSWMLAETQRPSAGRGQQEVGRETVMSDSAHRRDDGELLRLDGISVRLSGRDILATSGSRSGRASSPA